MIKNYIKIAWRNLSRNKTYTLVNIMGLTISLSICMLVATVVVDDFSYDKQWTNRNQLYRMITLDQQEGQENAVERMPVALAGLGKELARIYPEVEATTNLTPSSLTLKLTSDGNEGVPVKALFTDTGFFDLFDLSVIQGDPYHFIEGKANLVLTESFYQKYFPGQDIVGKSLSDLPSYGSEAEEYLVTGIVKDLPYNSHLRAEVLLLTKGWDMELNKAQYGFFISQYLKTKPGTDMQAFTAKMNAWYKDFMSEAKSPIYQHEFQPIEDIYLKSSFDAYQPVKASLRDLYIFAGVAIMILFISCANFINLSLTQNTKRLTETGVRKTFGAAKNQLIHQFLTENLLFFVAALFAAGLIYMLSLKPLETFLEHTLVYKIYGNLWLTISTIGSWFVIGIGCGCLPAYLLSKGKPALLLRKTLHMTTPTWQGSLIKGLITTQFTISLIVLLAVLVVKLQMNLLSSKELGYDPSNLLRISYVTWDGKGDSFKQELLRAPGILAASKALWSPGSSPGYMSREEDDPYKTHGKVKVNYIAGDTDLAHTLGLKLHNGRLLSPTIAMDAIDEDSLRKITDGKQMLELLSQHGSLITQTTAERLGIIGLGQKDERTHTIPVGIVADFHNESLKNPIAPTVIRASINIPSSNMLVRIAPGKEALASDAIRTIWKKFYPNKLLQTDWTDEILAKQYNAENKLSQMLSLLGSVSIALAVMGMFGMMMYMVERRMKEIGIRKVLGASVTQIVQLLSANFVRIIALAFLLSAPISGWLMHRWLQDYAYRITLSWWIFLLVGLIALGLTVLTIALQTIKAATANPIKALRDE